VNIANPRIQALDLSLHPRYVFLDALPRRVDGLTIKFLERLKIMLKRGQFSA
jgi:hypothetical protein